MNRNPIISVVITTKDKHEQKVIGQARLHIGTNMAEFTRVRPLLHKKFTVHIRETNKEPWCLEYPKDCYYQKDKKKNNKRCCMMLSGETGSDTSLFLTFHPKLMFHSVTYIM